MKTVNVAGKRYGRLVVLERAGTNKDRKATWLVRCDCGVEKVVSGKKLRDGGTVSCGCKRGLPHGLRHTLTYNSWASMVQRCTNPKSTAWYKYGARGIELCARWRESFTTFVEDMGERPSVEYTIERIDNDGHYEPGNCRWATKKEQARNRRSTMAVTAFGRTQPLAAWAEEYSIAQSLVGARLLRGWSPEVALTTPPLKRREWSNALGARKG